MIEFAKTYRNLLHILAGTLFLAFWANVLDSLGDLYFLPVFICCAVCAALLEFLQPSLKIGTPNASGLLKTLIVPIIFLIIESYHTIF